MSLVKIAGAHAVHAALQYSPKNILQAWVDENRKDRRLQELLESLRDIGLKIHQVDKKKLEKLADGANHQGIVVEINMPSALREEDLKKAVQSLQEDAFFLVLDHVQDPHNLGACLRTADATGVHGIILTKDQAVGITPTVCKVASGAAETIPVYQVTNLARTLRWMKSQNIWVIGTDGDTGQTIYETDMVMPLALVIGAEGSGMRRLTGELCDMLLKLPMLGSVESLNLSVATGVMLYEIVRQKRA